MYPPLVTDFINRLVKLLLNLHRFVCLVKYICFLKYESSSFKQLNYFQKLCHSFKFLTMSCLLGIERVN